MASPHTNTFFQFGKQINMDTMNEWTNDAYTEKWNHDKGWKTEDSKKALNYKPRDIRDPEQPRNRYRCKRRHSNPGLHKFSKNLGATSRFWVPTVWHEASSILRIRHRHTKLSCHDDLVPRICTNILVLENDHNGVDNLPVTMRPNVVGSYYNQVSSSPHLYYLFPPDTVQCNLPLMPWSAKWSLSTYTF